MLIQRLVPLLGLKIRVPGRGLLILVVEDGPNQVKRRPVPLAHKLNVAAVLEGSIRRDQNKVRITVQLINTLNGFHMWSEDYDRDLKNILDLQADIAAAVARQLQAKLLGDEASQSELGGTRNPEALDAYLRGGKQISLDTLDEAVDMSAVSAFNKAIQLDPTFAMAYAKKADALIEAAAMPAKTTLEVRAGSRS